MHWNGVHIFSKSVPFNFTFNYVRGVIYYRHNTLIESFHSSYLSCAELLWQK
jgi:hypothetical protein